jgi:hypothetical protein
MENNQILVINHDDNYVLLDNSDSELATAMQDPKDILDGIQKSGQRLIVEQIGDGKKKLTAYAEDGTTPMASLIYTSAYNLEKIITQYGKEYSGYLTGDESENTRLEVSITSLAPVELPLKFNNVLGASIPYKLSANYQRYQFFNRLEK